MYENYLSSIHNENDRPKTNYLVKLCKFLLKKFNFKEKMSLLEIGCGRCKPLNKFKAKAQCYWIRCFKRTISF